MIFPCSIILNSENFEKIQKILFEEGVSWYAIGQNLVPTKDFKENLKNWNNKLVYINIGINKTMFYNTYHKYKIYDFRKEKIKKILE